MLLKLETPPPTPPLEGRGVEPPPTPPKEGSWLPHCWSRMTAQLLPSLQGEGLGVGSLTLIIMELYRTKKGLLKETFLSDSFGARARLRRRRFHQAKRLKEPLGEKSQTSQTKKGLLKETFLSDSFGARTQDPNIKSVVLYQLS